MNKTQNYQLNQWEADDRVLRTDFNADNAKIDAALAALASGKGNCRIAAGSYTGTGTYGINNPNSLTFPFKPLAVVVACEYGTALLIAGAPKGMYFLGHAYATWNVTWNGNSLSWYIFGCCNADMSTFRINEETQMNELGKVYRYFVLGAADG